MRPFFRLELFTLHTHKQSHTHCTVSFKFSPSFNVVQRRNWRAWRILQHSVHTLRRIVHSSRSTRSAARRWCGPASIIILIYTVTRTQAAGIVTRIPVCHCAGWKLKLSITPGRRRSLLAYVTLRAGYWIRAGYCNPFAMGEPRCQ